jgi:hypothetical protein
VDAALDFWLTSGRYATRFEHEFARFVGVRHAVLCNSGSSANLLAVAALTSPKLGERRLQPGDEVVTVAAAFPTTVFPLVQYGLVPVFVDVDLGNLLAAFSDPPSLVRSGPFRNRVLCLSGGSGGRGAAVLYFSPAARCVFRPVCLLADAGYLASSV